MEVSEIQSLISTAQRGYDKYKPIFAELTDTYHLKLDSKTKKSLTARGKSSIYVPIINSKVKRIVNSFQEAYFSNDQFCKINSIQDKNIKTAQAIQEATDFYINHKIKLYEIMQQVFTYAPLLGTVATRSYWTVDTPKIEFISLRDIKFDPTARSFNDCRFIVHDVYLTKDEINSLIKAKVLKGNINDIQSNVSQQNDTKFARIKLQDVYFIENNQWRVSTVYNDTILLRDSILLEDGQPFTVGILQPQIENDSDSDAVLLYGDPAITASLNLQVEANIRRNQQIDAINRLLTPKVIIGNNSGINPLDILHPTKAVSANNVTDVNVLPQPQLQPAIFDLKEIEQNISENIGVSPQANGVSPARNMTATESSIVSNEGNMRLQSYIRSLNETLIEPLMERLSKLVYKYGEASFFVGLNRSDRFEFIAKVNTGLGATNKEIQTNGINQAIGAVGQLAGLAGQIQDGETLKECGNAMRRLVRELLPLYGIADVDNYFKERNNEYDELGERTTNQSETNSDIGISGVTGMEDISGGAGEAQNTLLPNNSGGQQGIGQAISLGQIGNDR